MTCDLHPDKQKQQEPREHYKAYLTPYEVKITTSKRKMAEKEALATQTDVSWLT